MGPHAEWAVRERERALTRQFSASLARQLDAGGAILGAFDPVEPGVLGVPNWFMIRAG
jgi:hypothetical protein